MAVINVMDSDDLPDIRIVELQTALKNDVSNFYRYGV